MADNFDLFKTAPAEVVRYFDAKKSKPTFDWRDIAPEEHAYSWTVAKSAGFDILDDIRAAMVDSIRNQLPFEHFRDQLTPILQQKVVGPKDRGRSARWRPQNCPAWQSATAPHHLLVKYPVGPCGGRMGKDSAQQALSAIPDLFAFGVGRASART